MCLVFHHQITKIIPKWMSSNRVHYLWTTYLLGNESVGGFLYLQTYVLIYSRSLSVYAGCSTQETKSYDIWLYHIIRILEQSTRTTYLSFDVSHFSNKCTNLGDTNILKWHWRYTILLVSLSYISSRLCLFIWKETIKQANASGVHEFHDFI